MLWNENPVDDSQRENVSPDLVCRLTKKTNQRYPYVLVGVGTSDDPCTDIYHGKGPFSEIEVKQVADKLTEIAHTVGLKSYWNIHAYSQLVLYPWSWTTKRAKDYFAIVSTQILPLTMF